MRPDAFLIYLWGPDRRRPEQRRFESQRRDIGEIFEPSGSLRVGKSELPNKYWREGRIETEPAVGKNSVIVRGGAVRLPIVRDSSVSRDSARRRLVHLLESPSADSAISPETETCPPGALFPFLSPSDPPSQSNPR